MVASTHDTTAHERARGGADSEREERGEAGSGGTVRLFRPCAGCLMARLWLVDLPGLAPGPPVVSVSSRPCQGDVPKQLLWSSRCLGASLSSD